MVHKINRNQEPWSWLRLYGRSFIIYGSINQQNLLNFLEFRKSFKKTLIGYSLHLDKVSNSESFLSLPFG